MAPVQRETTASYIKRLAARHQLTTAQLLFALGIPRPGHRIRPVHRSPYDTLELYFNAAGRAAICRFSGVPDEHMRRALPQWLPHRAEHRTDASSRARLKFCGVPSVVGCPHCTVARSGHHDTVRQYLPATALICPRHNKAMLGPHTLNHQPYSVEHADLGKTPEILAAHRDHLRFLRRYRDRGQMSVRRAATLTESWRRRRHREEMIWPRRARRIGHGRQSGL
ncbi:TniQ family protein [Actinacidiphila glaucinigra]|uniref:TniQ family protein n=1 Tax=Actinacidiphila glaucinigra TaxID=235986 RepID=UPI00370FEA09